MYLFHIGPVNLCFLFQTIMEQRTSRIKFAMHARTRVKLTLGKLTSDFFIINNCQYLALNPIYEHTYTPQLKDKLDHCFTSWTVHTHLQTSWVFTDIMSIYRHHHAFTDIITHLQTSSRIYRHHHAFTDIMSIRTSHLRKSWSMNCRHRSMNCRHRSMNCRHRSMNCRHRSFSCCITV